MAQHSNTRHSFSRGTACRARTTTGNALPTWRRVSCHDCFPVANRNRLAHHRSSFFFLASKSTLAQKTPPTQPININTATIAQLETLPGIGPNTAKSIVDFRNHSGPFQRVEDLLAIKGISKSKLEKLRPYVTVGPAAPNRHSDSSHQAFLTPAFSSPNFQKAM